MWVKQINTLVKKAFGIPVIKNCYSEQRGNCKRQGRALHSSGTKDHLHSCTSRSIQLWDRERKILFQHAPILRREFRASTCKLALSQCWHWTRITGAVEACQLRSCRPELMPKHSTEKQCQLHLRPLPHICSTQTPNMSFSNQTFLEMPFFFFFTAPPTCLDYSTCRALGGSVSIVLFSC